METPVFNVKGREEITNPNKWVVTQMEITNDYVILRIDDPTNPAFWAEIKCSFEEKR